MAAHLKAEPVTEVCTFHGEGAFWDGVSGRLLLVDMWAGAVLSWRPEDGGPPRRHELDERVAAVVRRRDAGGFVVAVEGGLVLTDDDLRVVEHRPRVVDDPALRLNEGGCHPDGSLYVGSMAWDETTAHAGTLYRMGADGTVTTALPSVGIPNGLVFLDGGRTAVHVDTIPRTITRYTVAPDGSFVEPTVLVEFDGEDGSPDGMALDVDGGYWVAMFGGSAVRHFDRTGELVEVVDVDATCPTSVAFGGPEGRTLYITTSQHADGARSPLSGSVFAVEVGVAGAEVCTFGG